MRIHPLIAGAAASVMLVSLAGVAALTGYLPGSNAEKAAVAKQAAVPCTDCGVVVSVTELEVKGKPTGAGAVVGGVAGAVVGHEIGHGRDVGTLVGAAGGAIAGHEIERHARTAKRFRVEVRLEDGSMKTVTYQTPPAWRSGDRVRVQNGKLLPLEQPSRASG